MKFKATKAKVAFKLPGQPGDRKEITLKEGETVEISERYARAFATGGKGGRGLAGQLGLVPATAEDERLLNAATTIQGKTRDAVNHEELAKRTARMEAELDELRENAAKGGGQAAQREIERLQGLLQSSEQARAELSETVRSFEIRLASLEADQKPKAAKSPKAPKPDSPESPEG